jgi:hypothetical protein
MREERYKQHEKSDESMLNKSCDNGSLDNVIEHKKTLRNGGIKGTLGDGSIDIDDNGDSQSGAEAGGRRQPVEE